MIYNKGDILKVNPLKPPFKSNVRKAYLVVVVSDSRDELVTHIPSVGFHTRTFNKHTYEWENGHRFRFEKIGDSSDKTLLSRVQDQLIS